MVVGLVLVAVGVVLVYIGMPNKNGESPRFLRFGPALVTYPPLILVLFGLGGSAIISALL